MIKGLVVAAQDFRRRWNHRVYVRSLPPVNEPRSSYGSRADVAIHSTALVAPDAELGAGVVIGPYAIVEGRTRIGARTQIGAHSVIKRFTSMGTGNRVYEYTVLGGEPQDLKFTGEESRLVIGNDNVIREGVSIHRATGHAEATIVGNRTYLMAGVHIAHNCEVGDGVGIANDTLLAGHVRVGRGAYLSAQVAVIEHCRIGRGAMAGGGSTIKQDVLPFFMVDGSPARLVGLSIGGLRSAGVPAAQVANLKTAYRLLSGRGRVLEESLEELARLHDPAVDELIAFVRSCPRGFCRARPGRARRPGGADEAV